MQRKVIAYLEIMMTQARSVPQSILSYIKPKNAEIMTEIPYSQSEMLKGAEFIDGHMVFKEEVEPGKIVKLKIDVYRDVTGKLGKFSGAVIGDNEGHPVLLIATHLSKALAVKVMAYLTSRALLAGVTSNFLNDGVYNEYNRFEAQPTALAGVGVYDPGQKESGYFSGHPMQGEELVRLPDPTFIQKALRCNGEFGYRDQKYVVYQDHELFGTTPIVVHKKLLKELSSAFGWKAKDIEAEFFALLKLANQHRGAFTQNVNAAPDRTEPIVFRLLDGSPFLTGAAGIPRLLFDRLAPDAGEHRQLLRALVVLGLTQTLSRDLDQAWTDYPLNLDEYNQQTESSVIALSHIVSDAALFGQLPVYLSAVAGPASCFMQAIREEIQGAEFDAIMPFYRPGTPALEMKLLTMSLMETIRYPQFLRGKISDSNFEGLDLAGLGEYVERPSQSRFIQAFPYALDDDGVRASLLQWRMTHPLHQGPAGDETDLQVEEVNRRQQAILELQTARGPNGYRLIHNVTSWLNEADYASFKLLRPLFYDEKKRGFIDTAFKARLRDQFDRDNHCINIVHNYLMALRSMFSSMQDLAAVLADAKSPRLMAMRDLAQSLTNPEQAGLLYELGQALAVPDDDPEENKALRKLSAQVLSDDRHIKTINCLMGLYPELNEYVYHGQLAQHLAAKLPANERLTLPSVMTREEAGGPKFVMENAHGLRRLLAADPLKPSVPNSISMEQNSVHVIFLQGAPADGKSYFMRSMAGIATLAASGAFVPASNVRMTLPDGMVYLTKAMTREDVTRSISQFMSEVPGVKTLTSIDDALPNMFVFLDEPLSGAFDQASIMGLSFVARDLVKKGNVMVIISNHLPEIYEVFSSHFPAAIDHVALYHVDERHLLQPGPATKGVMIRAAANHFVNNAVCNPEEAAEYIATSDRLDLEKHRIGLKWGGSQPAMVATFPAGYDAGSVSDYLLRSSPVNPVKIIK